ncbi:unnamed protein product [Linum tenue]|uniref:Uncharacterized protein n=1 Tax=Linum tenue TaxID=586396 RepID=A0AAV0LLL9_9ROSI|nr:unnamed protein product [Linum tenue]
MAPENSPAVLIFGDSILDTGNNNYIETLVKSNFHPYGEDFPGGLPTGRFSNGRLISDFIGENLGIKASLPPYLDPSLQAKDLVTGVCFASACSGYDPETPMLTAVPSIPNQLDLFRQYMAKLRTLVGEQKSKAIIESSLYVISAGNNDVGATYFLAGRKSSSDMDSYANFLVGQASTFIRQLHGLGARKIAHLSTIVTGCVPASRTVFGGIGRPCFEESNDLAILFNEKLGYELERLRDDARFPNLSTTFLDVYTPLFDIIQRPENYGFVDVKDGCCGTGELEFAVLCNQLSSTCTNASNHIFWDSVHLTEKAYKILTSEIMKDINKLQNEIKCKHPCNHY